MVLRAIPPGLSERWLRCAVGQVALCEAADFLYQRQLREFTSTSSAAQGTIQRELQYHVSLRLDDRGLHHQCDCRHAEFGRLCRHAAAVALTWIHSPEAPPPGHPGSGETLEPFGPWVPGVSYVHELRRQALERLNRHDSPARSTPPAVVGSDNPAYVVVGSSLDEGDAASAWDAAWKHGADVDQWAHLVRLRSTTDAAQCLPIYLVIIDTLILGGGYCNYLTALRWFGKRDGWPRGRDNLNGANAQRTNCALATSAGGCSETFSQTTSQTYRKVGRHNVSQPLRLPSALLRG